MAADLAPVDLRCEYAVNPLGVDSAAPRVSWKLTSGGRDQRQSAYRVLAADSAGALARGEGNLWDSGRVASDETAHIAYAGQRLGSSQRVYWKVRVWDSGGEASAWSEPATWTMGVLRPEEWQGKWITAGEAGVPGFEGANWIWHREAEWSAAAPAYRLPVAAAGAVRWFQKEFVGAAPGAVRRAVLVATADNAGEVWLNGRPVLEITQWERARVGDVTAQLRPGENLLAVRVQNQGTGPNDAGLLLKLELERVDGGTITVVTDESWRSTASAPEGDGWTRQPEPGWQPAVIAAKWGERHWGKTPQAAPGALPLFRRGFEVRKPVERALVHVSGLGHYELFLNGRKVGNRFLDPAWSVYERTVYYSSFDITDQLAPGANVFGVMLGKGFFNTAGDRRVHGVDARRPLRVVLQAHLFFTDGTEQVVGTDASWKTAAGPITHSAILGGEDYDARGVPAGWDQPGYNDGEWLAAMETEGPGGQLVASYGPPLVREPALAPVRIEEPAPGVFVYDFGRNAAAVPRLRVRGRAGQTLRLVPAEQRHGMSPRRNDGTGLVNPAGVGWPNYWQYTVGEGGVETWSPQFNYGGFQYLQVEGAVPAGRPNPDGKPVVEQLQSVPVRNAAPRVGEFTCSDPLFNAIDRIIDQAVRANLSHVLTDCPHREKLGWLEVSYLMGPSILGRYDAARFYTKIARDCADSQGPDGLVPTVAPNYPRFDGGFAYTPEWGAAAVVNPWLVHEWYGDRRLLERSYPTMKGFVDYVERTANDLVPRPGLGDWYDFGHGKPVGPSQFTPPELSAMATFRRCADIVAEAAAVLNRAADRERYAALSARIEQAFNERYFNGTNEYRNHGSPQTANSMALVTGLVPEMHQSAVFDRLLEDLRQRGHQQTAGDIGFWYLLQALAGQGRSDVLYTITARTNLGSYGYIVNNGWTSMPEAWDANTGASMNHCMLGHIQEWFLGWVAGIRPDPRAPGFKRFLIQPHPVGALTSARARYDSVRGPVTVAWERSDRQFALDVSIPPNTVATLFVPAADPGTVREGGLPLAAVAEVRIIREERGRLVLAVPSGTYRFVSRL